MVEVQSASSFHKLVHSQVITMKTLKEDTQIWRVCLYDMDTSYSRLLLISQKGGVSLNWPCLDTLVLVKLAPLPPALYDCYGCLMKIRRRYIYYHIKPGNWNEKNREPVVVIVDGSEQQKIAWDKTGT